jgi:uncharacterized membrane protein YkoI
MTMKSSRLLLSVLLASFPALAGVVAAEMEKTIPLNELPEPVQKAIETSGETSPVKTITLRQIDGKAVYEIELEKENAPNPRLRIAADGTILRDSSVAPGVVPYSPAVMPDGTLIVPPAPALRLEDLPAAVQATVRKQAAGREVADIDQESWKGRSVYEVEFRQSGMNPQIHVAEDGTLLQDERAGKGLKSLFMGAQVEDTPPAVQERIRSIAGDREVSDLDREGSANLFVYEVAIRDAEGVQRLRISEKGEVLSDSRRTAERTIKNR